MSKQRSRFSNVGILVLILFVGAFLIDYGTKAGVPEFQDDSEIIPTTSTDGNGTEGDGASEEPTNGDTPTNGNDQEEPSPEPPIPISGLWGITVADTCWGDLRYTPSGYGSFFSKHQIDLVANAGANHIRLQINKEPWDSGDTTNIYGIPYRDYIKQLVQEMHDVGIYVRMELAQYGCSVSNPDHVCSANAKIQMVRDTHPVVSSQDWIDWGTEVLQYIPEIDMITNIDEPSSKTAQLEENAPYFSDDWREFCIRCIEAWRAVRPNVAICVMGAPFYYLDQFFLGGGTLEDGGIYINRKGPLPYENIYYGFHRPYYTGWGSTFSNYYYAGDLTTGRSALRNNLDVKMKPLIDLGEEVILTASVAYSIRSRDDPFPPVNWQACMKDTYDWCLDRGVHQEQYGATTNWWNVFQSERTEILGAEEYMDWNSVGQYWVDYLGQIGT